MYPHLPLLPLLLPLPHLLEQLSPLTASTLVSSPSPSEPSVSTGFKAASFNPDILSETGFLNRMDITVSLFSVLTHHRPFYK
ncbi:hypothetical protein BCR39DRAFT_235050 [Naematelia encephala]|uniref:Secreted protein n=1 Tax=Naematelia encephala TaxID=71784 RepID=A0A1Y2BGY0_9TREE|nr:hypothetical protein BCR39DRAFT_235050 [Naematelia encephala]